MMEEGMMEKGGMEGGFGKKWRRKKSRKDKWMEGGSGRSLEVTPSFDIQNKRTVLEYQKQFIFYFLLPSLMTVPLPPFLNYLNFLP